MTQTEAVPDPVARTAIPALAQDLVAGTFGGWAQVVVGMCLFFAVHFPWQWAPHVSPKPSLQVTHLTR